MVELFSGPHLNPIEQAARRRFDAAVSAAFQIYKQEAGLPKVRRNRTRIPAVFPAWEHYQRAMNAASAEYDRAMGIEKPAPEGE